MIAEANLINPLLLEVLDDPETNQTSEKPSSNQLQSKYVGRVLDNKDKIPSIYEKNDYRLKCKSCGKESTYNLGVVAYNPGAETDDKNEKTTPIDIMQATGYFRCKYCNDTGN